MGLGRDPWMVYQSFTTQHDTCQVALPCCRALHAEQMQTHKLKSKPHRMHEGKYERTRIAVVRTSVHPAAALHQEPLCREVCGMESKSKIGMIYVSALLGGLSRRPQRSAFLRVSSPDFPPFLTRALGDASLSLHPLCRGEGICNKRLRPSQFILADFSCHVGEFMRFVDVLRLKTTCPRQDAEKNVIWERQMHVEPLHEDVIRVFSHELVHVMISAK